MSGAPSTTVLVTGASGFVGSAIARRLVRASSRTWDGLPVERVVALLRPESSTARIDELDGESRFSIARADLDDPESVRGVLAETAPRAVVHAALDERAYDEVDEGLVRRPLESLLDGMRHSPDSRLVHVGSAWVLASGNALDESARLRPTTPYARNKALEDALLPRLAEERGVQWINLRLFNVFGRYEKPQRLLPSIVAGLARGEAVQLTHGTQVRDFNDVDVAAGAFVHALEAPTSACGAVYHIGSGRGTTVREFALAAASLAGDPELISFGSRESQDEGLEHLVADPARAVRTLGWRPDTDLESRIEDAVAWWLPRVRDRVGSEAHR